MAETQRERFVELLQEMNVKFDDHPCNEDYAPHLVVYLRDRNLHTEADAVESRLNEDGTWHVVTIDHGNGFTGHFCDMLFAPDGNLVTYGCEE